MAEPAHKQDTRQEPVLDKPANTDDAVRDDAGPQAAPAQPTTVSKLPRTHYRHRHILRGLTRFVLMVVLPIAIVIYGASLWAEGLRYVTTENAYVKANLLAVSSDVSGRVIEINVKDNQHVNRGEMLFRLDPREFQLEIDAKAAELEEVKTEIEALRAEYRAGQRESEELQDRLQFVEREFNRAKELADRGVGTTQRLDEARHDVTQARGALTTKTEENRMVLAELGGRVDISVENHPKYQSVLAEYDRAVFDLERATVIAPADGFVSNVNLRLGEYVRTGTPVFSMVESQESWIEVNLKETQLTHVEVGQQATLVADAFPDVTYNARIDSISPATGAEFALLPPQNASGNWVKVVQRIPVRMLVEAEADQPRLRAGMTVTVSIDTQRERTLGLVIHDWLQSVGGDSYLPAGVMTWLAS